jgi:hypothetical protein
LLRIIFIAQQLHYELAAARIHPAWNTDVLRLGFATAALRKKAAVDKPQSRRFARFGNA